MKKSMMILLLFLLMLTLVSCETDRKVTIKSKDEFKKIW